jgi:hypothetical protein
MRGGNEAVSAEGTGKVGEVVMKGRRGADSQVVVEDVVGSAEDEVVDVEVDSVDVVETAETAVVGTDTSFTTNFPFSYQPAPILISLRTRKSKYPRISIVVSGDQYSTFREIKLFTYNRTRYIRNIHMVTTPLHSCIAFHARLKSHSHRE